MRLIQILEEKETEELFYVKVIWKNSLVGVTMVLNRMSQSDEPLGKIYQSLPQFTILKDKINIDGIDSEDIVEKATALFENIEKNTLDGVKFIWENKWVHLRKSKHRADYSYIFRSSEKEQAKDLIDKIKESNLSGQFIKLY